MEDQLIPKPGGSMPGKDDIEHKQQISRAFRQLSQSMKRMQQKLLKEKNGTFYMLKGEDEENAELLLIMLQERFPNDPVIKSIHAHTTDTARTMLNFMYNKKLY